MCFASIAVVWADHICRQCQNQARDFRVEAVLLSATEASMRPASYACMQFHPATSCYSSPEASAEIYAYIAVRDFSLATAERSPTQASLSRAYLANELVENCLRPARSPYQAQSLTEAEAKRERKRCDAARTRLAQLRACAAVAA